VLPITCIALVRRLGHDTGGRVEACGSGLLRRGLNAEFQHSVVYYATERCGKNWKHELMQVVVTLNTCCDIACLTFQLPHITTGTLQPPMTTHNWLFSEPPTSERTQQTFSQIRKFYSSQVSVVTFSGGVGGWITDCFL